MAEWTLLGPVVKTQIHTDRMVDDGRYHADKIVEVDALWLGEDGVLGTVGDSVYVHAHHRLHPNKVRTDNRKNYRPTRLVSFGFTGHYEAMAAHFGAVPLGCAAEDIIIDHDAIVSVDQLAAGVQIRRTGSDRTAPIDLVDIAVAKPCVPFTKWLLDERDAADDRVAPNRAFLEAGMRGFVMGLANQTELRDVVVGDEFWVRA